MRESGSVSDAKEGPGRGVAPGTRMNLLLGFAAAAAFRISTFELSFAFVLRSSNCVGFDDLVTLSLLTTLPPFAGIETIISDTLP